MWLGAEISLGGSPEDYLLYGIDEGFLREHPGLWDMTLPQLHRLTGREGVLLVQAHPFRPGLRAAAPRDLDGVEIYNGNPRQQNHNDQAAAYCRRSGLIATGGSDYHQAQDLSAGMRFERPLPDSGAFVRALGAGRGRIIVNTPDESPGAAGS